MEDSIISWGEGVEDSIISWGGGVEDSIISTLTVQLSL